MSDQLESMLEELEPARASEPAPAFLRAVARRRHTRRLRFAASLAAVAVVVVGGRFTLTAFKPTPVPAGPGPIAVTVPPRGPTLAALTRQVLDRDPGDIPIPAASTPADPEPLRLGLRCDSPRFERWLSQ